MEKVRIQDDLYTYVNQEWMEQAIIPEDRPVIAIGVEGDKELESIVDDFVSVPKIENKDFYALPMLVLCQLFALHCIGW